MKEDRSALPPPTSPGRRARLRKRLLAWYDSGRRDLPWRRSRDPYAIWVSETMLQQTRVESVIPYYTRFLERFPDLESLASADREEVYACWAGLGYYSRARNLQRSAQMLVAEFGASLPDDVQALRQLPGVGRYTAGAVASIAFDRREAAVDGNVVRVLTRVLEIRGSLGRKDVRERLWAEAGALANCPRPGDLNQALMEFGARVCRPRSPACGARGETCPVKRLCRGFRAGDVESLPNKPGVKKPRPVEAIVAWLPRHTRVLAVRRPETGLLANLWELPGGEIALGSEPKDQVVRLVKERTGLEITNPLAVGSVGHVFSHLEMTLHVFRCRQVRGRVRLRGYQDHRWIEPAGLAALPQAALARKALELLA